jgi:GT2 family glycosyltransferase
VTEAAPAPAVSVVVCTVDRYDHLLGCLRSILDNPGSDFELLVVDQNAPEIHQRAIAAVGPDPRLRWIWSGARGLSRARNRALEDARAPVLAFTDDDCRVPVDWVERIGTAFRADPELSLLFGATLLRPEDWARGWGAEFEPVSARELRHTLPDGRSRWGVGANMAIHRRVFERVGGFDVTLGAGAPLRAGEEIDLTIRAIRAGLKVLQTPDVSVLHLGVREGAEAGRLMRGYGIGLGATFGKHVRLHTPGAKWLLAHWLAIQGGRSVRRALAGDPHPGFGLMVAVALGACKAYTRPLDHGHAVFT